MEIVKKIEMHFQEWFKEMRRAILEVNSHVAPEDRELSLTELFRKYRESIPLETFRLDSFHYPEENDHADYGDEENFITNLPGYVGAHEFGTAFMCYFPMIAAETELWEKMCYLASDCLRVCMIFHQTKREYPLAKVWLKNDYFDLPFEVSLYANREGIILVRLVRDFAEQPLLRDYLEQDPVYLRESCDLNLYLTELIDRCR